MNEENDKRRAGRIAFALKKTDVESGQRYGHLEVIKCVGMEDHAGRGHLMWLCKCDCGETIVLPRLKLRNKDANFNYIACEKCSQKTCVLCGGRYPRKRRWPFCESLSCIEFMQKERKERKNEAKRRRYASNPNFREQNLEKHKKWRAAHPGYTWAWIQSLPAERREAYMAKAARQAKTKP